MKLQNTTENKNIVVTALRAPLLTKTPEIQSGSAAVVAGPSHLLQTSLVTTVIEIVLDIVTSFVCFDICFSLGLLKS